MYFSARVTPAHAFLHPTVPLTTKSLFFQSPTIHSARTRHNVFSNGTSFGKLHKSSARKENSSQYPSEKTLLSLTAQNWRKNVEVNVDKEDLEKGLREYLGISQPFRPKTSSLRENTSRQGQRALTSQGGRRIMLGSSSVVSFRRTQMQQSACGDGVLRRELMCSTDEFSKGKDFTDENNVNEKFEHIKFIKAPSKEFMRLLKLSNYDVTLVPSDSRRIVVEAILRDFFLNLIPENSDFLICKNSQTQIYTITFTGRLVPLCKTCTSATRFEISSDLGFQVLCNSPYCDLKVLYMTRLDDKASECLWPVTNKRTDVEPSLRLEGGNRTPAISKIIQSGKYKNSDFSRVVSESVVSLGSRNGVTRPSTTGNTLRGSNVRQKFSQVIIKTGYSEKFHTEGETVRCNTVQGLRRPAGGRPGTSGSMEAKEFKGASVLKEFDDRGMFSREKEIGVIEQVSEEISRDEEEVKNVREERKVRSMKGSAFVSGRVSREKKGGGKKGFGYSLQLGKRNVTESQEVPNKLDNSMEDIHNMVNLMNKGK